MSDLRAYGPGKFDTVLDSFVYDLSLDGCLAEESGDVSESGTWYGLLIGPIEISEADLTDSENAFLAKQIGAILSENDQGFVDIEYFESAEDLEDSWSAIAEAEA